MDYLRHFLEYLWNVLVLTFLDVEIETTTPWREDTSTLTSTTENFLIYNDDSQTTTLEERNFYHQIPSSNNEKSTFAWSKSPPLKFEIESLPVILLIVASLPILF